MTIFHDKLGNRLAMTETDALALGYTYKHKGLKMSEKVNQECSSTKANELANALKNMESGWFDDLTLKEAATMLRQQQAEIEDLKAKLQLHDAMDNQCASLMQQFRKVHEK